MKESQPVSDKQGESQDPILRGSVGNASKKEAGGKGMMVVRSQEGMIPLPIAPLLIVSHEHFVCGKLISLVPLGHNL